MSRDRDRLERLSSESLTYSEVGATAGNLPAGYHHLRRSEIIGNGSVFFADASETLMSWQMHSRAGLRVVPSAPRAVRGVVVLMRLGIGGLGVAIPCRVVYEIAEKRRIGFAYGTLPGHPERGEESFVVELFDDDQVRLQIVAFSKPARWFTQLAGPISRRGQALMTDRYIRALHA